jgi:hypothetical protein
MRDSHSRVDGARVLADLNALGGIGDYKTDVHKPIFSEGKPVTCPVRQPTKLNLILNMKVAKLLGLKKSFRIFLCLLIARSNSAG